MDPTALSICRRLLQAQHVSEINKSLSPTTTAAAEPTFQPINAPSSSSPTAAADDDVGRPFSPNTPLDSTKVLIILILVTAVFFVGFFSVYYRLSAAADLQSPPSPTASVPRRRPPPPNRKGGLDPSAVGSLPLVAYGRAAEHRMIDDCPICLSEFQEGETVKLIPYCGHVFHPSCIDTWLSSHVTCPLCRSTQLFKEEGLFGCGDAEGV
ncbi:hypothetical protein DH2020_028121 [Rehmannia glutinosa]|uniref:RING-type E3 ubiquitin transferase n=1 Tax=Rehmannia glutinosa TaxID=99300 RepID=A0ABR0VS82_REHGL